MEILPYLFWVRLAARDRSRHNRREQDESALSTSHLLGVLFWSALAKMIDRPLQEHAVPHPIVEKTGNVPSSQKPNAERYPVMMAMPVTISITPAIRWTMRPMRRRF